MRKKKVTEPHDIIIDDVTVLTIVRPIEEAKEIEISEIDDLPEDFTVPEKEPEPISEMDEMKMIILELRNENQKLFDEVHKLKFAKKVLSLGEAQELFKKKMVLIDNLKTFKSTLDEIESCGDFNPFSENPIQTESYRLIIENTKHYEKKNIFQTANVLVISTAVKVVKDEILQKVEELETEISTIDFI